MCHKAVMIIMDRLFVMHLQAVLLEAIEDAGFEGEALQEADSNTVTLLVEGMTCSSCSSAVENAVASQKGVVSAAVNLLAKRAEVGQPACASGSLQKLCKSTTVTVTSRCGRVLCSHSRTGNASSIVNFLFACKIKLHMVQRHWIQLLSKDFWM